MPLVELTNQDIHVNLSIPIRYDEFINESAPNKTALLLHGYGLNKERMFKSLGMHLTDSVRRLVVLNAPFPLPYQDKDGNYKEGYAWYFKLFQENVTLIPPENCEPYFEALVEKLSLASEDVTLIGYSQGGYVMPYLAKKILKLNQMIGISCGVPSQSKELFESLNPKFNLIHSDFDSLSSVHDAECQFNALNLDKVTSQFLKIPGGHEMDSMKIGIVKKLIGT